MGKLPQRKVQIIVVQLSHPDRKPQELPLRAPHRCSRPKSTGVQVPKVPLLANQTNQKCHLALVVAHLVRHRSEAEELHLGDRELLKERQHSRALVAHQDLQQALRLETKQVVRGQAPPPPSEAHQCPLWAGRELRASEALLPEETREDSLRRALSLGLAFQPQTGHLRTQLSLVRTAHL